MKFHNLGHISLKKVDMINKFPLFWFLVQKVGASKSKGKFR